MMDNYEQELAELVDRMATFEETYEKKMPSWEKIVAIVREETNRTRRAKLVT